MLKKINKFIKLVFSSNRWSLYCRNKQNGEHFQIEQNKNIARADNFLIKNGDKIYIFYEEFICEKNRRGYLCAGIFDYDSKKIINSKKVLDKSYHLSYPNIFKIQEDYYMIPESSNNKTLDLYKFEEFPYKLKKIRTLLRGKFIDSSIVEKDSIYYIFTSEEVDNYRLGETLSIYYVNDILHDELIPLKINPVKIGYNYSRMAGKIEKKSGKIYRYAQDCSGFYGAKLYKFEVLELTKDNYKEVLIETISPPRGYIATHTYSCVEDIEVIDVIKQEINIFKIVRNLCSVLYRNIWRKNV